MYQGPLIDLETTLSHHESTTKAGDDASESANHFLVNVETNVMIGP